MRRLMYNGPSDNFMYFQYVALFLIYYLTELKYIYLYNTKGTLSSTLKLFKKLTMCYITATKTVKENVQHKSATL